MERTRSHELKIGVMVFVSLIVITLAVFYVGDYNFFVEGYEFKVIFNQASGITLSSPVNLNGIKVGEVKNIDFIYVNDRSKIRLNLWVNAQAKIRANCRITIDTMGLMGEKVINIISRDASGALVKGGDELIGIDPPQIGEIISYGNDIARELKSTIKAINLIVGDVQTKNAIRNNLKNTEKLTRELGEIVSSSKDDIEKTIGSAQSITASIDGILKDNRDNFTKTVDNLQQASVVIKTGSAEVHDALKEFADNVNKLLVDNYDDVSLLIDNLAEVSIQMKTRLEPTLKNLEELSVTFNGLVGSNKEKIKEIVDNLHAVTGQSRENILRSMENLEKVSADFRKISEHSQQNIQDTINNVSAISQQVKEVLEGFRLITEKIEKGEGTLGGLLSDKEIFDDLKKLIKDVNANPWKLLRKE